MRTTRIVQILQMTRTNGEWMDTSEISALNTFTHKFQIQSLFEIWQIFIERMFSTKLCPYRELSFPIFTFLQQVLTTKSRHFFVSDQCFSQSQNLFIQIWYCRSFTHSSPHDLYQIREFFASEHSCCRCFRNSCSQLHQALQRVSSLLRKTLERLSLRSFWSV